MYIKLVKCDEVFVRNKTGQIVTFIFITSFLKMFWRIRIIFYGVPSFFLSAIVSNEHLCTV